MNIAFIIFNEITYLDFIGFYDPMTRLKSMGYIPDLHWDICAFQTPVKDRFGLEICPTKVGSDLSDYELIFIPGGFGTRPLISDIAFVDWIRTGSSATYKVSVCTGSLILGAAGFLKGKRATTHFNEYDRLRPFCKEVLTQRIVEDDGVITAGAVSASLDLGLFVCEKLAGKEAREAIRKAMDYRCLDF